MVFMKKVMAIVLVAAMTLSLAFAAFAAGSPTTAPTTPANPGFDAATGIDKNTQDHKQNMVTSKLAGQTATATAATATSALDGFATVTFTVARDVNNNAVNIAQIGDGTEGVFNTKEGQAIKTAKVKSEADKVVIATNSFKGSKVSNLYLSSAKVTIQKNAFKGTKAKNLKITINGSKKKASAFSFKKDAFKGLNKKAKIVVKKSAMSAKEFKKLVKKLRKAGFKGSIVRK